MRRCFFLCITVLALAVNACHNKPAASETADTVKIIHSSVLHTSDSLCAIEIDKARTDAVNKRLKYYSFGIAAPSREFVDSMKNNYDIEVVSLGCAPTEEYTCYNRYVDSLLKK